ncbi:MAG: hypothetical protein AAFX55_06220 [Bacteroidota bacterium]
MMKSTQIVVVGGVITIIGAICTLYGQYLVRKDKKELLTKIDLKNDKIKSLNEEQLLELDSLRRENIDLKINIDSLKDDNSHQTKELGQLRNENYQLSKDLAKASIELTNNIIGGDSYCYLAIGYIRQNSASMTIVSQGKYPIYEVQMRIVDLELFNQTKGNFNLETMDKTQIIMDLGNLPSKSAKSIGNLSSDFSKNEKEFNVFFSARNGFFTQTIRMKKVKGVWKTKTQVTKQFSNEILFQRTDDGFPRNEEEE